MKWTLSAKRPFIACAVRLHRDRNGVLRQTQEDNKELPGSVYCRDCVFLSFRERTVGFWSSSDGIVVYVPFYGSMEGMCALYYLAWPRRTITVAKEKRSQDKRAKGHSYLSSPYVVKISLFTVFAPSFAHSPLVQAVKSYFSGFPSSSHLSLILVAKAWFLLLALSFIHLTLILVVKVFYSICSFL